MESACAVLYCGVLLVCLSFTVYQVVKKKPTVYDMSLSHKHNIFRKKSTFNLCFDFLFNFGKCLILRITERDISYHKFAKVFM